MEILLVNHKQTQCGVYQYGKRLSDILKKIEGHTLTYVECDSAMELLKHIEIIKPNLILYNWHELTMKWVNPNFTKNLGNTKQIFIYHEAGFNPQMKHDALIYINFFEDESKKIFTLPRPIFENELVKKTNDVFTIGSFGFGFHNKGFERICELVNSEFDVAKIKLHIPNSFFCDISGQISNSVINNCKKLVKDSISLEITNNFMTNYEILEFLNSNDVNMFLYDQMPGRGLSSTIDYAISVDTPLIVNNSVMFRHITQENPEISIDNKDLNSILSLGLEPVHHFRKQWSNDNLRNKFIKIIEKTC
jgi:hypothetical protein